MFSTTINIEPKHYFRLSNGQIIKSINELPSALESINEDVFRTHVTPYKNDFAKWIYDVFKLEQLPKEIGHVKSKEELSRIVKAYLMQNDYTNSAKYLPGRVIHQMQAQETITIQQPQQTIPEKKQEEQKPIQIKASAEPIPKVKQQQRRIYVWKTNESVLLTQKPKPQNKEPITEVQKPNQVQKEIPKVIESVKEVKKVEEPKKIEPKEIIEEKKELPKINIKLDEKPITDADEYFEKNPVLMSQYVDARKKTQEVEQLEPLQLTGKEQGAKLVELFKDNYARAYQKMSTLRKIGYDTSLTEMMLFRIPTKIKLFESSLEEKDAITVKRYINEAIEELNNMK